MASKRKSKSHAQTQVQTTSDYQPKKANRLALLHLNVGWWLLLAFVILGVVLESLHGFKVAWYLNVGQESRRLLWRLAHAHGTFLALVNIGFAVTLWIRDTSSPSPLLIASRCLLAASLLVPLGFFLGGTTIYANDPGVGIILLPIGAVLLVIALGLTAYTRS